MPSLQAKLDALGRLRDQMQQVVCLKTRCQATRDELSKTYKEAFIFGVPVRYPEWKGCKLAYKKAYVSYNPCFVNRVELEVCPSCCLMDAQAVCNNLNGCSMLHKHLLTTSFIPNAH